MSSEDPTSKTSALGDSKRGKRRKRFRRRTSPGAAPGTLVGDPQAPRPRMTVIAYSGDDFVEQEIIEVSELQNYLGKWRVLWLNIEGPGNVGVVQELGELFGLHRLSLEDVLATHQRPKFEQYEHYYFIVARMLELSARIHSEQLSLFLGQNFVLTFQEFPGDCFGPIRERIFKGVGRIRVEGSDYLAYSILDAVVDSYFPVLEELTDRLDEVEEEIINAPKADVVTRIHGIKRDLLVFRRVTWPLRDVINFLLRDGAELVNANTRIYLRDCYDHTVQLIDLVETCREIGSDLVDVYLSSTSFKLNEVMKVLTIISTIFIPLTFIAGVYGMNFDTKASPYNMPELEWYYGYPLCIALMLVVTFLLLYFFKKKGWLDSIILPQTKN